MPWELSLERLARGTARCSVNPDSFLPQTPSSSHLGAPRHRGQFGLYCPILSPCWLPKRSTPRPSFREKCEGLEGAARRPHSWQSARREQASGLCAAQQARLGSNEGNWLPSALHSPPRKGYPVAEAGRPALPAYHVLRARSSSLEPGAWTTRPPCPAQDCVHQAGAAQKPCSLNTRRPRRSDPNPEMETCRPNPDSWLPV